MASGTADGGTPSVLQLQANGTGPALFCICGLHAYQVLADALPTIPVYGMFLDAEHLPVEIQAASYVRALREHQSTGPYLLAGFSFGGILAYEVAQQLVSAGQEVRQLTMLDIWLPSAVNRTSVRSRLSRMRARIARRSPERDRDRTVTQVMRMYSVRPYAGAVRIVRAHGSLEHLGASLRDPSYGWRDYVERLVTVDLPGDHVGILGEPGVKMLARELLQDRSTLQLESM